MLQSFGRAFGFGGSKTAPDSPFGAPRDENQLVNELMMISQWGEKEIRARAPNVDALIQLIADIKSGKVKTPATARKKPVRDMGHQFNAAVEITTSEIGGKIVKTLTPPRMGKGPTPRTADVDPPSLPFTRRGTLGVRSPKKKDKPGSFVNPRRQPGNLFTPAPPGSNRPISAGADHLQTMTHQKDKFSEMRGKSLSFETPAPAQNTSRRRSLWNTRSKAT